jgi:hypothetical protein
MTRLSERLARELPIIDALGLDCIGTKAALLVFHTIRERTLDFSSQRLKR